MSLYWVAIYIIVIMLGAAIIVGAVLRVSLRSKIRYHESVSSPEDQIRMVRETRMRTSGVRTRTKSRRVVSLGAADVAQTNAAPRRRHNGKTGRVASSGSQIVPPNAMPKQTISVSSDLGLETSSLTSVQSEESTTEATPMKSQKGAANGVVPKETESNEACSVFAPVEEDDNDLVQLAGSLEDADVGGLLDFTEKI
jgi:hypothetical protein